MREILASGPRQATLNSAAGDGPFASRFSCQNLPISPMKIVKIWPRKTAILVPPLLYVRAALTGEHNAVTRIQTRQKKAVSRRDRYEHYFALADPLPGRLRNREGRGQEGQREQGREGPFRGGKEG